MQQKSPRIRWLEERVTGDQILDIGFVGEYEDSLTHQIIVEANSSAEVVGIDIKAFDREQISDSAIRGDAFNLPIQTDGVDTVVFAEVLEHLRQPYDVLTEIHRILHPGGRLYLTTPNPFGLYRYLRHYLFKRSFDPEFFLGADDHIQFLEPNSLSSLIVEAGFTVEELTFRNVAVPKKPTLPDWEILQRFPLNRGGTYTCLIAKSRVE